MPSEPPTRPAAPECARCAEMSARRARCPASARPPSQRDVVAGHDRTVRVLAMLLTAQKDHPPVVDQCHGSLGRLNSPNAGALAVRKAKQPSSRLTRTPWQVKSMARPDSWSDSPGRAVGGEHPSAGIWKTA